MRWLLATPALLLLAASAPAIGSFHTALDTDPPDRTFLLAMSGTTFNGLHAPHTPLLEAYLGERVRFVVLASEPHTFHVHGHPWRLDDGSIVDTFLVDADRPHAFDVTAGGVDRHAGDWLYHCHINAHVADGMWGVFRVYNYTARLLPGMTLSLARLGEPVEGADVTATVDGAPLALHAQPRGAGTYALHADLPPQGELVVTAIHPTLGASVARLSLEGAPLPTPSIAGLESHHAHP